MDHKTSNLAGFTLIEVLIYSVVFVVATGLLLNTLTVVTKIESNQSTTIEVISQMDFVLQNIKRLVAQSSAIEVSGSGKTITLYMPQDTKNPTKIKFKNPENIIEVQEGGGQWVSLTTEKVKIDSATFALRQSPGGFDAVEINLTMSAIAGGESRTARTTIARANAATFDSSLTPTPGATTLDLGAGGSAWRNGLFSGSIGIGVAAVPNDPANVSIQVGGGVQLTPRTGAKPSCPSAVYRGLLWLEDGGAGTDQLWLCANSGWKSVRYN